MTMYETSDLLKRVERYEAAMDELRAAHQDVRSFLIDQVLYDRWLQIGSELGFAVGRSQHHPEAVPVAPHPNGQQHDLNSLNQQIPQLTESWAS